MTSGLEPRRLDDLATLVARADSRIGRATVERFAAEGARVHAAEVGSRGGAAVRERIDGLGRLDILVIAPADTSSERFPQASLDDYRAAMDRGLRETFFLVQRAVRAMNGGGRICIAAPRRPAPIPSEIPAPATIVEGGLMAMVRLLAVEVAPIGIAVNAVCPVGPRAEAASVAAGLAFLASADASYVSGASVPVLG